MDNIMYKEDPRDKDNDSIARNQAIFHTIVYAILFLISIVTVYELYQLAVWSMGHNEQIGLGILGVMFLVAFGGACAVFGIVIMGIKTIDGIEGLIIKDYDR